MSKVFSFKSSTPRSPEREELAALIVKANDARLAEEAARVAVDRAHGMVDAAEERLSVAAEMVASARASTSTRIASTAQSGALWEPDRSLRDARAREVDAADNLEATRAAMASVEAALGEATYQYERSKTKALDAAKLILSGAAERLIELLKRQQAEAGATRAALGFIYANLAWPTAESQRVLSALNAEPYPGSEKDHPSYSVWRDALAKLTQDADTQLP